MNTIPQWLVEHYTRAKKNGWIAYFQASAAKYKFRTEDVLGVASRESNMKNIKGDFHDGTYHGFSLMQLDINSHRAWINAGSWQDVAQAIDRGCAALAEKRDQIVKASKQSTATVKFRSGKVVRFTPKAFNDEQLRQMTIAGYNCGVAAYYHFSAGHSIDSGTTGKDYSRDVLGRSEDFKDLMDRDHLGKLANDREIEPPATVVGEEAALTPEPVAQAQKFPFEKIQEKYDAHADLVQSPTVTGVAKKAGIRIGGGLASVWSTTGGRIAIVLTGVVVLGGVGSLVYTYRHQIMTFLIELKDYIKGKF